MAQIVWTNPDPLNSDAKSLSIYLKEIQEAIDLRRSEIDQDPFVGFYDIDVGKTALVQMIEQLKTVTNTLAEDYGYEGGVANIDLLGRDYSSYGRIYGKFRFSFPIINDLRKVLNLLEVSSLSDLVMLSSDTKWGNYSGFKVDLETGIGNISFINSFEVGNGLGAGSAGAFNKSREILEFFLNGQSSIPLFQRNLASVRILREDGTKLITHKDFYPYPDNNIGPLMDDRYVYLLYIDGNSSKIQLNRYWKDDRSVIDKTLDIQGDIPSGTFPVNNIVDMAMDEFNIYLTGFQVFHHADPIADSNNFYPNGFRNSIIPDVFTQPIIIKIPKSMNSGTSLTVLRAETDEIFDPAKTMSTKIHSKLASHSYFTGIGIDDNYIYTGYNIDVGGISLHSPPHPNPVFWDFGAGFFRQLYKVGSDGSNPSGFYQNWIATDYLGNPYSVNMLQWVFNTSPPPIGGWIGYIPNDRDEFITHHRHQKKVLVRIPKNNLKKPEIIEDGVILVDGGPQMTVSRGFLYVRYGNALRIYDTLTLERVRVLLQPVSSSAIFSGSEYSLTNPEESPPTISNINPFGGSGIPVTTTISLIASDTDSGVDKESIELIVNGVLAVQGTTLEISGDRNNYNLVYTPSSNLPANTTIPVSITIYDLAGNRFTDSYTFKTE